MTARKAMPGSLYGATKWAVTALGESVRQQMRESGIGVSVVEPGIVDTEFWPAPPSAPALSAEDVAATVLWIADHPSTWT